MADIAFNTATDTTIKRELMVAYLNTSSTSTPVWSAIGKRVVESSAEYDWAEESNQDILGDTRTKLKKPVITQTFDPVELDSGDAAAVKIWNAAIKDQDYTALANMDMLIVHKYAGTAESPFAERYSACAIKPSSIGGEGGGTISMPFEVTYGGTRTKGTASVTGGVVTFTPDP